MALLVALLSKQEYGTLFSAFRARLDTETALALDDVAISGWDSVYFTPQFTRRWS